MSVKLKNRHQLKKKEIREILNELKTKFNTDFFNVDSSVEIGDLDQFKVILVDDEIDFMVIEDKVFFTIRGLLRYNPKETAALSALLWIGKNFIFGK